MDPVKIAGVTEWPAPMNKKEVQSFLGFTNFYRRFIKDFSEHARPLFDLTRNDSRWRWEEAERTAQELWKSSTRSLRSAEWSECDGLLYYRSCIYVPNTSDLRHRIVSLCHDTKVAGHPGRFKTLELVSRSYWWPNMSRYIGMAACSTLRYSIAYPASTAT